MTETTPPADPAERRTRYATAIREEVRLRLGTNALALAERGQPVQMNFSEAETAADAAIGIADAELLAAAAVPAPAPTDKGALRDRIRRAVCEAEGFGWDTDMLEPDEYGEVADAVLAVLPAPADRAAILRESADTVDAMNEGCGRSQPCGSCNTREDVADALRRLADAASGPGRADGEAQRPRCPHCQMPHDLTPDVAAVCASIRASIAADEAQQPECSASRSGDCLREAESETACDTEAGECVHGGKPGGEAQQDEPDDTLHACPGRWGGPSCTCFDDEQPAAVSQPGKEA
jgi:hypothetical protein